MTVTLKKADGDIFIDAAGRGKEITGAEKVDQEMFCNYATPYDVQRNWGSNLQAETFTNVTSAIQLRTMMYAELVAANRRHLSKQSNDPYLDPSEQIQKFDREEVFVDQAAQSALFISTAVVGDSIVTSQVFQPISTRQVLPPPFPTGLSFFNT